MTQGRNKEGWIYFLYGEKSQLVKIGWTSTLDNLRRRKADIQVGHGHLLELCGRIPGSRETERTFHRKLAHLRAKGEWFKADDETIGTVRAAIYHGIDTALSFPRGDSYDFICWLPGKHALGFEGRARMNMGIHFGKAI